AFRDNAASSSGAANANDGLFVDCLFEHNYAENSGGGFGGVGTLTRSTFRANRAVGGGTGGGGASVGDGAVLTDCRFIDNRGEHSAGAARGPGLFVGCLFEGNQAPYGGACA